MISRVIITEYRLDLRNGNVALRPLKNVYYIFVSVRKIYRAIKRVIAYNRAVTYRNALKCGGVFKRVLSDFGVCADSYGFEVGAIRKGVIAYRFRSRGKVRIGQNRFFKRVRAYLFKTAERRRRKCGATRERIRADLGYVGSDYRSDIRFTRERAVCYRSYSCVFKFIVGKGRLGRNERKFVVFGEYRAAVFCLVRATFFYGEFRNVSSRKGVFAYDGYVLAERYVRKGFTVLERARRDNRRVYLYRSKFGTVREYARTYLYLVGFKGYALKFFIRRKRAYAERLRTFGQSYVYKVIVFKRVVSDSV